jgi:UDP-GlcNAc:undecaprenyl-phosphate/decaprenyl-phosphate GlcNAc-1-phosphate transferase
VGCGLLGLGIVMLLTPLILRAASGRRFNRARDPHHTNKMPIPRLGGIALVGAFVAVEFLIVWRFPEQRARIPGRDTIIFGSLAMFALGFWDDVKPLGARKKLFGQIVIAAFVCYAGIGIESFKIPLSDKIIPLHGWGTVFTVVWLVGITNLINLIDGVDGLAGGICLMLMGLLVYVGYQNGTFVFLTAGMAGAILGFLFFNFPPAKIYLGDGGAYFLGFQIGLYSIVSSHKGTVVAALIAPLFVLALPIVDTALAILRRGARGLPVFRPDRRHIHHHLLRMGLTRRQVVLWLYGITLVFLVMGFVAFWSRGHLIPVLLGMAVLLLLLCAGKLSFSREWFAVGRTLGNSLSMRQEIQYALSLTKWLSHEGERCASLEDLFADIVFAARRLGFSRVRVTLADGPLEWAEPNDSVIVHSTRHEMQGGLCGILELEAPTRRLAEAATGMTCETNPAGHETRLGDPRLYEIMAELLAEAWVRAASKWKDGEARLSFACKPPLSPGVHRRAGKRQGYRSRAQASQLPALSDGSVAR